MARRKEPKYMEEAARRLYELVYEVQRLDDGDKVDKYLDEADKIAEKFGLTDKNISLD
jgi:hypothetical protein